MFQEYSQEDITKFRDTKQGIQLNIDKCGWNCPYAYHNEGGGFFQCGLADFKEIFLPTPPELFPEWCPLKTKIPEQE